MILVWILLALLAILLIFVLSPMLVRLRCGTSPEPFAFVELRLLAGLLPPIRIRGGGEEEAEAAPEKLKERPKKRRKRRQPRNMARTVPRLLVGLLDAFRFEELRVEGSFGLGDPAATGELFGKLTPILYGIPPSERIVLAVHPDFGPAGVDGEASATIRFRPARLIPPAVRFAWASYGPRS